MKLKRKIKLKERILIILDSRLNIKQKKDLSKLHTKKIICLESKMIL